MTLTRLSLLFFLLPFLVNCTAFPDRGAPPTEPDAIRAL